jgi:hypothetical protein
MPGTSLAALKNVFCKIASRPSGTSVIFIVSSISEIMEIPYGSIISTKPGKGASI